MVPVRCLRESSLFPPQTLSRRHRRESDQSLALAANVYQHNSRALLVVTQLALCLIRSFVLVSRALSTSDRRSRRLESLCPLHPLCRYRHNQYKAPACVLSLCSRRLLHNPQSLSRSLSISCSRSPLTVDRNHVVPCRARARRRCLVQATPQSSLIRTSEQSHV